MKEKKYRHRTKVFGIPVPGFNHPILPSVEMRKWQFIENLLLAATRGVDSCLFNEGALTIEEQEDGSYKARMSTSSGGRSVSGIAGGRYFECRKSVEWAPLSRGYKYFLYMVTNVKTMENPRSVRAVVSRHRIPTSSVLVAEVNLKGDVPKVNTEPAGKASRKAIESHVGKTDNPHGKTLFQDELCVKKLAILGSIEVDDKGPLNKEGLRDASLTVWRSYRVESGGRRGVVVKTDGSVRIACASFEGEPEDGDAIWVGYHGIDKSASKPEELVVYNKTKGVALRVAVLCER